MKHISKVLIGISVVFGLAACGGGGGDAPKADLAPDPVVRTTEYFGQNGNLWKPSGDAHAAGAGNLVILPGPSFAQQFDSCELQLKNGEIAQLYCLNTVPWTHTPYSCYANGNRQHWRASFKCSEVAEVKVVCRLPNVETTFTVADEHRGNVCWRFG